MLKNTVFSERNEKFDPKLVSLLSSGLGISNITARALLNRGITNVQEAEAFLYPNRNAFHDPFGLPDMNSAVERITEAIECEENILIYGDYDTDGVCATAILYKTLQKLGANVMCFIPDRHKDGYGMNKKRIEEICAGNTDLIITVDNGVTAIDEIALCTDYSISVIVTDHHIPCKVSDPAEVPSGAVLLEDDQTIIPRCEAVVVPSRCDSKYACQYLCGAGVAFKLSVALLGKTDPELLGLAALATVADVVPLQDENRVIVKLGIPNIKINKGISVLLENAGFEGVPDEQTIGFVVSPRINAAGRMGDAERALRLLITDDEDERVCLSDEIQSENEKRRSEENRVIQDIFNKFSENELEDSKVIVLKSESWDPGVLGIAASKLVDRFYCPVLLFTRVDEQYVGSGRSIPGIDLHDLLSGLQKYFVRFGGHAMAAGVTIKDEQTFNAFVKDITEVCSQTEENQFVRKLDYDQVIELPEISEKLYLELQALAPFGEKNPYPSFRSNKLSPVSFRKIGKNEDHLDGSFKSGNSIIPFVAFKMADRYEQLDSKCVYDIIYTIDLDCFRNIETLKLRIIDFHRSEEVSAFDVKEHSGEEETSFVPQVSLRENESAFLTREEYNKICCFNLFTEKILSKENFEAIERKAFIRKEMMPAYRRLCECVGSTTKVKLTVTERIKLCIFFELGFFVFNENGKLVQPSSIPRKSLNESSIYNLIMSK